MTGCNVIKMLDLARLWKMWACFTAEPHVDLGVQGYAPLMGLSAASVTGRALWAFWRAATMIG